MLYSDQADCVFKIIFMPFIIKQFIFSKATNTNYFWHCTLNNELSYDCNCTGVIIPLEQKDLAKFWIIDSEARIIIRCCLFKTMCTLLSSFGTVCIYIQMSIFSKSVFFCFGLSLLYLHKRYQEITSTTMVIRKYINQRSPKIVDINHEIFS